MPARFFLIMLSLLTLGMETQSAEAAKSANSKQVSQKNSQKSPKTATGKAKPRRAASHIAHRLVPPPPAYMPSILPELYYKGDIEEEEEVDGEPSTNTAAVIKPKNPYAKYFYSADHSVPKAVQARSGVSTWTQTR